ncbi:MAG: hypothetical protein LBI72_00690 [Flavobacteriaceae bacterium]|jgi:hypothetical protein|nr:hypothetical protein [Flavobacteriaceae bacterium]
MVSKVFLHPNYRISTLSPYELINELKAWTKEDMLAWLYWSNCNGVITDDTIIKKMTQKMKWEEAVEIIMTKVEKVRDLVSL